MFHILYVCTRDQHLHKGELVCVCVYSLHGIVCMYVFILCVCVCLLQLNNLYDMQHMWYEVRCGDAHLTAGQLGKALKKYTAVAKHFTDFAGEGI